MIWNLWLWTFILANILESSKNPTLRRTASRNFRKIMFCCRFILDFCPSVPCETSRSFHLPFCWFKINLCFRIQNRIPCVSIRVGSGFSNPNPLYLWIPYKNVAKIKPVSFRYCLMSFFVGIYCKDKGGKWVHISTIFLVNLIRNFKYNISDNFVEKNGKHHQNTECRVLLRNP